MSDSLFAFFNLISVFKVTFADYSIRLTTTTRTVAQISSDFATNLGTSSFLVREGSLTIPAFSFPHRPTSDVGPAPFGPLISFTTPFTYTGESLLIEIRHSGNGGSSETTDVDVATTGGSVVNTSSQSAVSGIVPSGPCIVAKLQVKTP